ncbi:MAG: TonB-dependent receptor [Pseudomonadota bacterium]
MVQKYFANSLCTALLCGASLPALLISTANAQSSGELGNDVIVVTAQKRAQALEDVPISLTVFGADELERANIDEFADYALRTPNVSFVNRGTRSQTRIAIRGISPISTSGSANLTGIFVDEFNIAPNISTRTADPQLFDTEQIEILRGPQSTFFGRNVVAGALSITSKQPSLEEAEAELSLEAGSFDFYRVRAAASVPLSDTVAVRGLFYYDENGGFLENQGSGPSNGEENFGGRVSILAKPTDQLTLSGSVFYTSNEQDLPSIVPSGFLSESVGLLELFTPAGTVPVSEVPFYPENAEDISTDIGLPSENETLTLIGRMSYDFENNINLTVIGGYIENEFRSEGEGDYTSLPAFTIRRDEDVSAFSIESRLSGSGERHTWMIGAIYAQDDFFTYQNSIQQTQNPLLPAYDAAFSFLGGIALPGFAPFTLGVDTSAGFFENVEFELETKSYAFFAEYAYDVTDRLNISLGGRYSNDEIKGERRELPLMVGLAPRLSTPEQDVSFDDFSPRIAATYELNDTNTVYAVASRGYRTGGFNTSPGDPAFDAESLWNYEIGVKGSTADQRFRYGVTAFMMDWENTQVRAQDLITQRQFILNAEGSEHNGVEVELGLTPLEGLDFEIAYGYVDATFNDFANARTLDGDPIDATGFQVPLSPENTFSALVQYERPLTDGLTGFVRGVYSYVDETREDVSLNDRRLNPAYEVVDFRLGMENESWSLQGYVENAFDEEYRFGTTNLETYLSGAQVIVGRPRNFGVLLTARF